MFKIGPLGRLTILTSFNATNGAGPSSLILGSDGNFYGTAAYGGVSSRGTVFKVTPGGDFTTLVSFDGTNGSAPTFLILGDDGNLYGSTAYLGPAGAGTVFRLTLKPTGSAPGRLAPKQNISVRHRAKR